MNREYMTIWEFIVAPEHARDFEGAYGASGEWVALFRRARGYLRTELHRDRARSDRYVTIDYWESQAAWETFRAKFAEEFTALDARCERWTKSETVIGRFERVV